MYGGMKHAGRQGQVRGTFLYTRPPIREEQESFETEGMQFPVVWLERTHDVQARPQQVAKLLGVGVTRVDPGNVPADLPSLVLTARVDSLSSSVGEEEVQ